MKIRKISLLGSTGSIGTQALDVIDCHPDIFKVISLSAGKKNLTILAQQIIKYKPKFVAVPTSIEVEALKAILPKQKVEFGIGEEGLIRAAEHPDANTVIGAMVGFAGLLPIMAAIKAGKRICLANKETLVSAGKIVTALAKEHKVPIIPIDSEHSAVFQALAGKTDFMERIILTASGGPFWSLNIEDMERITPSMALKHPNWNMGSKITIDSATMMNKGLEVIEAHWLFNADYDKIDVVIHPQSIVHSLVEFCDGSVIAQLGLPDMRLPILYSLTCPERVSVDWPRLSLPLIKQLTFFEPDSKRFPSLFLAREAGKKGLTYPAVLNAANEVAVELFLAGKIGFLKIPKLIELVLESHEGVPNPSVNEILEADYWARNKAKELALKEKVFASVSL